MQNLGRLLKLRRSKLEGCARIVEGLDPDLSRQGQETSYNSQKRGQKPPRGKRAQRGLIKGLQTLLKSYLGQYEPA